MLLRPCQAAQAPACSQGATLSRYGQPPCSGPFLSGTGRRKPLVALPVLCFSPLDDRSRSSVPYLS